MRGPVAVGTGAAAVGPWAEAVGLDATGPGAEPAGGVEAVAGPGSSEGDDGSGSAPAVAPPGVDHGAGATTVSASGPGGVDGTGPVRTDQLAPRAPTNSSLAACRRRLPWCMFLA